MDYRQQIRDAIRHTPVTWLYAPAKAIPAVSEPASAKFPPALIPPVCAAVGAVCGGGLAATGLYLNRPSKSAPIGRADLDAITCNLTIDEIEERAVQVYEEAFLSKDDNDLKRAIAPLSEGNAKILPVLGAIAVGGVSNAGAAAFLAGATVGAGAVVAGAVAARN